MKRIGVLLILFFAFGVTQGQDWEAVAQAEPGKQASSKATFSFESLGDSIKIKGTIVDDDWQSSAWLWSSDRIDLWFCTQQLPFEWYQWGGSYLRPSAESSKAGRLLDQKTDFAKQLQGAGRELKAEDLSVVRDLPGMVHYTLMVRDTHAYLLDSDRYPSLLSSLDLADLAQVRWEDQGESLSFQFTLPVKALYFMPGGQTSRIWLQAGYLDWDEGEAKEQVLSTAPVHRWGDSEHFAEVNLKQPLRIVETPLCKSFLPQACYYYSTLGWHPYLLNSRELSGLSGVWVRDFEPIRTTCSQDSLGPWRVDHSRFDGLEAHPDLSYHCVRLGEESFCFWDNQPSNPLVLEGVEQKHWLYLGDKKEGWLILISQGKAGSEWEAEACADCLDLQILRLADGPNVRQRYHLKRTRLGEWITDKGEKIQDKIEKMSVESGKLKVLFSREIKVFGS